MSHVAYPKALPVECVTELVTIIRSGKLVEKKAEAGVHAWNVQGYIQRMALGDPSDDFEPIPVNPMVGYSGMGQLTDEQAADYLDQLSLMRTPDGEIPKMEALPLPLILLGRWVASLLLERLLTS